LRGVHFVPAILRFDCPDVLIDHGQDKESPDLTSPLDWSFRCSYLDDDSAFDDTEDVNEESKYEKEKKDNEGSKHSRRSKKVKGDKKKKKNKKSKGGTETSESSLCSTAGEQQSEDINSLCAVFGLPSVPSPTSRFEKEEVEKEDDDVDESRPISPTRSSASRFEAIRNFSSFLSPSRQATANTMSFVSIGNEGRTEESSESETKEMTTEEEAAELTNEKAEEVLGQFSDIVLRIVARHSEIPPLVPDTKVMTLYQTMMTPSIHDIDSRLVALVSLFPLRMDEFLPKQNRVLFLFQSLGIQPIYIDGSDPRELLRRNELFEISGKWGVYPQVFVRRNRTTKFEFFADFDQIEALNDCKVLRQSIDAAIY